jgi:hypothetical protein
MGCVKASWTTESEVRYDMSEKPVQLESLDGSSRLSTKKLIKWHEEAPKQ